MIHHWTRRGFLGGVAAAGLAVRGLGRAARAADDLPRAIGDQTAPLPTAARPRTAAGAPLTVVTQAISTDVNPRAKTWGYITEILRRAGLFFAELSPAQLPSLSDPADSIVVLAGHLSLSAAQREVLTAWVRNGGSLIGIGGTSGLDEVFGISGQQPLAEGWMRVTAADHPLTAGLRSSLHVFGGYLMKRGAASSLAEFESDAKDSHGSAILENRFGRGRAILLAADLLFSIVHIQQGLRVLQNGKPAPDGSAPINDGILKSEDGLVLDWQRDRQPLSPNDGPVFLEPITDELREIILRSIFYAGSQAGISLPMLWYWPGGLKGVGHISHDTDFNEPEKAVALLKVMNRCEVKSTWCTLYPGGYPAEFYRTLQDQGFEIGLHYDAKSGGPATSWSKEDFLLQQRWLMKAAGLRHVTTNKNHYLRWEGRLDLFRWCEEAGIESDQTRGPSKKGTIGFPLGGSQPYFPLDDEADSPRMLNVLEVNLMTQDLVVTCPAEYGKQLLDSALRHNGVAHFLFHPSHILKAGVAESLGSTVECGRTQGIEWWTNEQICRWEKLRRGVEAAFDAAKAAFTLRAAAPAPGNSAVAKAGKETAVDHH